MQDSHPNSSLYQWDAGLLLADRAYGGNDAPLGLLLGGLCLGLPALIGVLFSFCCKCLDPRNLTVFSVSLVFAAILQSLSTPVVVLQVMGTPCYLTYCPKLLAVWFASRHCGTLLHLLVALEFILSQRQSQRVANMRSVYWCLPVVLTLDLICLLFFEVTEAAVALGVVALAITLMICIMVCKNSSTINRQTIQVVTLAVVTFGATYCPSFAMECMILNLTPVSGRLYDIFLCLTNIRLITDAKLCFVVSRNPSQEYPQQRDIGLDNHGVEP